MKTVLAALLLGRLALGAASPAFECTDGAGVAYRIWIGPERNLMQITEKGKTREIPLSGANIDRGKPPPGTPLVYNGWNRLGKNFFSQLDLSTEFVTAYVTVNGETHIEVYLVVDHRERPGLICRSVGVATKVVTAALDGPAALRHAAIVDRVASLRTLNGPLLPVGVLTIEAAVQRMFHSPDYHRPEERTRFVEALGPTLKNVDPRTVNHVTSRLSAKQAGFWKTALDQMRYKYYPEGSRFATWVKEGTRPEPHRHLTSIVAGFNELVKSPVFLDKDLRAFFVTEITPSLKGISEEEARKIRLDLGVQAETFFTQLWSKAVGKRTLSDFPEIERVARDIGSLVEAKDFDPQKLQIKLLAFYKSPTASDPDAMAIFVENIGPQLRRLSPRQREDVLGWLEADDEKAFFLDLLD